LNITTPVFLFHFPSNLSTGLLTSDCIDDHKFYTNSFKILQEKESAAWK